MGFWDRELFDLLILRKQGHIRQARTEITHKSGKLPGRVLRGKYFEGESSF
jgi:hypothetical protein